LKKKIDILKYRKKIIDLIIPLHCTNITVKEEIG